MLVGKVTYGATHALASIDRDDVTLRVGGRMAIGTIGHVVERRQPAPRAVAVDDRVARDAVDPGIEGRTWGITPYGAQGAEEDVGGQILGVTRVRRAIAGIAIHPVGVAFVDQGERLTVVLRADREGFVREILERALGRWGKSFAAARPFEERDGSRAHGRRARTRRAEAPPARRTGVAPTERGPDRS